MMYKTAQKTAQNSTREQILELLKNDPGLTKAQLMKLLGKASGTINEHIQILQKEGKLKRVGGRKNGHWSVTDV